MVVLTVKVNRRVHKLFIFEYIISTYKHCVDVTNNLYSTSRVCVGTLLQLKL